MWGRNKRLIKLRGFKEPRFIFHAHSPSTTAWLGRGLGEGSAHGRHPGTWTDGAALLNVDLILALHPSADLFSSLSRFYATSNSFSLSCAIASSCGLRSCPSPALFNSGEGLPPAITSTQQFISQTSSGAWWHLEKGHLAWCPNVLRTTCNYRRVRLVFLLNIASVVPPSPQLHLSWKWAHTWWLHGTYTTRRPQILQLPALVPASYHSQVSVKSRYKNKQGIRLGLEDLTGLLGESGK